MRPLYCIFAGVFLAALVSSAQSADLSRYDRKCGIKIDATDNQIIAAWQSGDAVLRLTVDTTPGKPIIRSIEQSAGNDQPFGALMGASNVQFLVTIGSRTPPDAKQKFPYMYFDKPAERPHQTFASEFEPHEVVVESEGHRVAIRIAGLSAGPFAGELVFRLYAGSPLIQIEAAMTPRGQNIAYFYVALLDGQVDRLAYEDLDGQFRTQEPTGDNLTPLKVHYRTLIGQVRSSGAEQGGVGSIAIFPTPHAYFYPCDFAENQGFVQFDRHRFGIRQSPVAGGAGAPWFDAPDGKVQRMDFFVLPSGLGPQELLERVKRYTHGDTFVPLEGHKTFTSHVHAHLVVNEMAGKRINGNTPTQEFASVFKKMGINIVHLAEFHRQNEDGHFRNTDSIRLDEMKKMFELYHQYSDDNFLLLPGEEGRWYMANPWPPDPKIDPGHWMSFFPRPVYFTWLRAIGQPFAERIEPYGMVYHLDGREDAIRLFSEQQGLGWTSHPRIKASFATPDAFKDTNFYRSKIWLGAAWKSMPVDLSNDRLGRRPLDLLDDMSNWAIVGGYPLKAMPGEIDLFEIDRSNELYANMNTNYLQLDNLPHGDDWTVVLDALRERKFFTTTGEILIHSFAISEGKATVDLEWTFPLSFVELISGDGTTTHRQRIDLSSSAEFGRQTLTWPIEGHAAKWIRLEACDVARDLAFSQPIDLRSLALFE